MWCSRGDSAAVGVEADFCLSTATRPPSSISCVGRCRRPRRSSSKSGSLTSTQTQQPQESDEIPGGGQSKWNGVSSGGARIIGSASSGCLPSQWTSWSPSRCDSCIGRQSRRRTDCGRRYGQVPNYYASPSRQERACFSPELCHADEGKQPHSETIRHDGLDDRSLPRTQPLAASFVPYLHVGPWSKCQPAPRDPDGLKHHPGGGKGKKKRKRNKKRRNRERRAGGMVPKLPPNFIENSMGSRSRSPSGGSGWSPELPTDLEITFVANSVAAPRHGMQRRTVTCRGQDGEELPFR